MAEYLQRMLDLALRKELQGIHFWATFYVLIVLVGTLWHALRCVRGHTWKASYFALGFVP